MSIVDTFSSVANKLTEGGVKAEKCFAPSSPYVEGEGNSTPAISRAN